jgi:hypothetical protein
MARDGNAKGQFEQRQIEQGPPPCLSSSARDIFCGSPQKKKTKRQKKSIETAGVTDREGGAASTRQAESSDTAAAQSSPARAHGQGEGTLGRGVVVGQLFVDANEHREKPTRTKQTQRSRTKTMLSRYRRHPSV